MGDGSARRFEIDALTDQERHAALLLLCGTAPGEVDEVAARLAAHRQGRAETD